MSDDPEQQQPTEEQHQDTSEHIISAAAAPYAVVEDPSQAQQGDGAEGHVAAQPSTDSSAGVDDEGNPLRTLFMSGFPVDVKKREIHNLFRFAHGFESVSLNNRGRGPVAFVTFMDQPSALAARSVINQTRFDPEIAMDLHVELAKNNSFAAGGKKRGPDDVIDGGVEKRARHESVDAAYSRPPPSGPGDKGPITTLFVANLGMYSTEDELRQLFAMLPGFRRLRFNQTKGAPVAFIDYTEVQYAQQAKQTYEGYKLPSSPSPSGLRIEFAKNNMGGPPDPPMKPMGYPGYAIPAPAYGAQGGAQAYNPYGSAAFPYPAYPGVGVPYTYDPNAQQHHPYK